MPRVPVAATLRFAYGFAISHLGAIIGLIWVPMVLITVAQYFTLYRYYNDFIDVMASGNVAQIGPSLLMVMGYMLAALLLYAVMLVAVVQLALGTRSHGAIAHFAFGPLEWRMFRALFAFVLLMLLAVMIIIFAVAAAGTRVSQVEAAGFLMIGLIAVAAVLVPRFVLLLPALAVSETAPVLRRSWILSSGNFLSLFAIFLGLAIPVAVVLVAVEAALDSHAPLAAGANAQLQLIAAIMRARQALPLTCGVSFFISPLLVGLYAGASVSSWRALKDEPSVEITA